MNFGPYIPHFPVDSEENSAQEVSTNVYCPVSFVTLGSAKTTVCFGA